jgi:predicted component of type VI protein secretion system
MADVPAEAQLFVLAGPDLARSFPLGERATLGRAPECDVVLRDRSISRKHAVLVRQGTSWFVQDLGSTNGVSKDGKRAERIELHDGDEFKLGDLPLRLKVGGAPLGEGIEFALDGPALPGPSPVRVEKRELPPASSSDEVEIEEEIELEEPGAQPKALAADAPAPTTFRPPRAERRTGLLTGDLSQYPAWLQALLVSGLLVAFAGLAYGAYRVLELLRSGS